VQKKLISLKKACEVRAGLKRKRKKVVFTNGCFDILHAGHVRYLTKARACGDILILGLNSDKSVRGIKGPSRPINSQQDRVEVLSALSCIDYIVLFNDKTPQKLIESLIPDVLAKGSDWAVKDMVGADVVIANGGCVRRVRLVQGRSTSNVIERIQHAKKK